MKIALLTNILTPYRSYFYDRFYEYCKENKHEFEVLVASRTEDNRVWKYEDYKKHYTRLLEGKTYKAGKGSIYVPINTGLKKTLNEVNPDILVLSGSYLMPAVWEALRWAKKTHTKVLYWSESHLNEQRSYSKLKLFVRESIRKQFFRRINTYWYAGKLSQEFLRKYAPKDAKYIFVPNLINEQIYREVETASKSVKDAICQKYSLNGEKQIFFCPARLSRVKGIVEFINLFKECGNKDCVQIVIAGEGELREEILQSARKADVDVVLVGMLNQEQMLEIYQITDFVLLPSLSDPNPLTCIEASWCGIPLIISAHVGNGPEIVRQLVNGGVFDYGKPTEAVELIECLIEKDAKWRKSAREYSKGVAEKIYNYKNCIPRIVTEMIED